jgi:threonine synthase
MDGLFVCRKCNQQYKSLPLSAKCGKCDSLLDYEIPKERLSSISLSGPSTFWRYDPLFPSIKEENKINWNEGGTPFFQAKKIFPHLNLSNLFLKDETKNPTQSYSDRATSLLLSYALEYSYRNVICASNGNSGASVAAYSARSPINCKIIVPKKVTIGKLAQMHIFSDNIVEFGEMLDDSIAHSEELSKKEELFQVTPEINPLSIEAQATIAYEIIEATQATNYPDWIIVPMGAGGLLWSIWKGFKTFREVITSNELPRIIGVQAAGCAQIVEAFQEEHEIEALDNPTTNALELLIRNPYWGDAALFALKESKGNAISVTDKEIFEAKRDLARSEGIFAETASSATLAGLKKLVNERIIDKNDNIVCLITGSGIKEPYIIKALSERPKLMSQKVGAKLEILRFLETDESYGYAIWQAVGSEKSIQSIYQHLNELENKDLIKSKQQKNKKYFEITDKGKKVLSALETLVDLF